MSVSTASFPCSIELDGGESITERGVCISQSPNPTTDDSTFYGGSGLGTFNVTATGLTPNTEYHVRAYAINSKGTFYGSDKLFKTMDPAWILPPCTISPNTFYMESNPQTFNYVSIETGDLLFEGNFALKANGLEGDLNIYFSEEPITGKYVTASSVDEFPYTTCFVDGIFGGFSGSFYFSAAPGDTVYVENLGNGNFKMSFCDLTFASTEFTFTGKGNITK